MRPFTKIAAVAALAAGMAMAQAQAPQAQPAPRGQARPGMMKRMMRQGALRQRMIRNLNLTDAQKQQAKTIFQQARETAKPVRAQLKQERQALAAAVKANDAALIGQLSANLGHLQGELTAIRSGAEAKFYAILTPDQKAKADQMRQRAKQMFQRRGQRNNNG